MKRRSGSILVVVLFVMTTLGLVALSFAYQAGCGTRRVRDRAIKVRLLAHARSAGAIALARLQAETNEFDHPAEPWCTHRPLGREEWLEEWSQPPLADRPVFVTEYRVVDEEGKLNVLQASGEALRKLGMSPRQVAGLLDWMDGDRVTGAEGAEEAFYLRYRGHLCKDAPMEMIEELAYIRGFFDGGPPPKFDEDLGEDGRFPVGWSEVLTCLGDGRVNLNTARRCVLETLPLSEGAAGQIVAFRDCPDGRNIEDHAFRSAEDVQQLQGLTETDREVLLHVGKFKSNHFRIFVRAVDGRSRLGCRLEALVRVDDNRAEVLLWKIES